MMAELTAYEASILDRVPEGNDGIASHEIAHTLTEFAALHRLERKGCIEVVYEPNDCWVSRA